jgi:hypothetical protein
MIALADPFQGEGSATLAPVESGEIKLTFTDVPPAAVPVLRALLAISHTLARVERIALCAIVRRKSRERVLPLLERHQLLLEAQTALATTFVSILHDDAAPPE